MLRTGTSVVRTAKSELRNGKSMLRSVDWALRTSDSELLNLDCDLRTDDSQLRTGGSELRTVGSRLRTVGSRLRTADWELRNLPCAPQIMPAYATSALRIVAQALGASTILIGEPEQLLPNPTLLVEPRSRAFRSQRSWFVAWPSIPNGSDDRSASCRDVDGARSVSCDEGSAVAHLDPQVLVQRSTTTEPPRVFRRLSLLSAPAAEVLLLAVQIAAHTRLGVGSRAVPGAGRC